MAAKALNRVLQHLREAGLLQDGAAQTDGELLELYASRRDEAAFEALVRRHGPMVLGVCRRILHHEADAEDAFQATFLVLVRKAGSLRARSLVGNWLYGVAHNTALKAKAMNRMRRQKERQAGTVPKREAVEEVWAQVQALLDAELSRLPDRYRIPIVLCDLEGQTIKGAARHLGWPQGTMATRLTRGRALLARRLAQHGLTLSGGVLTAALSHGTATAGVPAELVLSTVRAASLFAVGQAAATGAISATVAALTEGVVKSLLLTKLKVLTAVLLAVMLLGWGGLLTYGTLVAEQRGAENEGQSQAAAQQDKKARPDKEAHQPSPPVEEVRRHDAWLAASKALRQDPSLLVYYPFQAESSRDGTLLDQARGRRQPHDGTIVGCSWVTGRWPGKQGLEFKRASDRVRLRVPGEFESVTLVAWVRVDALPNVNHSLLLADGWPVGALHWQIGKAEIGEGRGEGRKLVLAVKLPPGPVKEWSGDQRRQEQVKEEVKLPPGPVKESSGVEKLLKKFGLGGPAPPPKPTAPRGVEEGHYHAFDVFGPERLGKWVQLAVVYDRDQRQVTHYVDGRPAARLPIHFDVPLRIGHAQIGNWQPAGNPSAAVRYFDGCMDEFLLFSRALSDKEIGRLYTEDRPPK